nr:hypothetical protein [Tanacetum cinerariifolium]
MITLKSMCEMVCQIFQKKQEEKRIEEEQAAKARYWKIPACCDDDDDYNSAITPILSTEETENSLKCLSCGALYTGDFCCSKGNVEDKILVPKPPKNCARCGHPVNGPYCQGCALLREKLEKDLVTYFQNFQNTSESSDDSTNIVNAPREPFVVKQDHSVNPPHIDKCCCECGNALDGIYCQQCICKSCGKVLTLVIIVHQKFRLSLIQNRAIKP